MAGLSSTPLQSCLYTGRVRHRRFTPVENAFTYSGYWVYLDLDELDRVFAGRWLWSASGPALARFSREDHLLFPDDLVIGEDDETREGEAPAEPRASLEPNPRPGSAGALPSRSFGRPPSPRTGSLPPLQDSIRDLVKAATGSAPTGPIRLLTQLRMFGYLINPVSFYYCFDPTGSRVETVIAEVNNTPWGERHCYVLSTATGTTTVGRALLPVSQPATDKSARPTNRSNETSPQSAWPESISATVATAADERLRFEHAKRFHVSPFIAGIPWTWAWLARIGWVPWARPFLRS